MNPDHVAWCRKTFDVIRDGGGWGIPRSGLIFTKRNGRFELTERMPHDPAMPITASELREQQDREFSETVEHFAAAGIEVVDRIAQPIPDGDGRNRSTVEKGKKR